MFLYLFYLLVVAFIGSVEKLKQRDLREELERLLKEQEELQQEGITITSKRFPFDINEVKSMSKISSEDVIGILFGTDFIEDKENSTSLKKVYWSKYYPFSGYTYNSRENIPNNKFYINKNNENAYVWLHKKKEDYDLYIKNIRLAYSDTTSLSNGKSAFSIDENCYICDLGFNSELEGYRIGIASSIKACEDIINPSKRKTTLRSNNPFENMDDKSSGIKENDIFKKN